MIKKHITIKRIVHRITEECRATICIAKSTSLAKAINTFIAKIDIQIMNRNGYKETKKVKKRLLKKHETIMEYIEKEYKDFILKYDFKNVMLEEGEQQYRNKIWICWWQGFENAPIIVKKCIESIKNNTSNHDVIIITEKNYKKFINIPDYIEEKRKKGIISITHYSDLLRLEILSKYAGIWLDATFFCTKSIDKYFELPIWSIKRPDYLHCSIAGGYFANYSLGTNYENRRVYGIIRDFLLEYWRKNDMLIDYLLTDYLIVLAQRHDPITKKLFQDIVPNNKHCDELFKIINEPYNEEKWLKINKETGLFKLTWKQNFSKEKNGHKTFYNMLINEKLCKS